MSDVKITVMPCGQGDSVLLEWQGEDGPAVGIIDCNDSNENPTRIIHYLKQKQYKSIDFITMTHPHSDHYSGIEELLDHCENSEGNITLNSFLHSSCASTLYNDDYQKYIEEHIHPTGKYYQNKLRNLFVKVKNAADPKNDKKYINEVVRVGKKVDYRLNKDLALTCLAPTDSDFKQFERLENSKIVERNANPNNPNANFLSIVFALKHIKTDKCLAIFSSDCMRDTLERFRECKDCQSLSLFTSNIPIIQIPHHGSEKNFSNTFWDELNLGQSNTFLSVGRNSYGHPNTLVVSYFIEKSLTYRTTSISDFSFFQDDALEIWSKSHSSEVRDDNGSEIKYSLDYAGNCKII